MKTIKTLLICSHCDQVKIDGSFEDFEAPLKPVLYRLNRKVKLKKLKVSKVMCPDCKIELALEMT